MIETNGSSGVRMRRRYRLARTPARFPGRLITDRQRNESLSAELMTHRPRFCLEHQSISDRANVKQPAPLAETKSHRRPLPRPMCWQHLIQVETCLIQHARHSTPRTQLGSLADALFRAAPDFLPPRRSSVRRWTIRGQCSCASTGHKDAELPRECQLADQYDNGSLRILSRCQTEVPAALATSRWRQ